MNICLNLNPFSKYAYTPPASHKYGSILIYLQDSFRKLLFNGRWTWSGTAPAPVTTAKTRHTIPSIENLLIELFKFIIGVLVAAVVSDFLVTWNLGCFKLSSRRLPFLPDSFSLWNELILTSYISSKGLISSLGVIDPNL